MDRALEFVRFNNLFDLYGNLLNEREQEIFKLFYEEDLSLQEIADQRKVSKSAIGSAIQIINKKLEDFEQKLGFLKKEKEYLEKVALIKEELYNVNDVDFRKKIAKILEISL